MKYSSVLLSVCLAFFGCSQTEATKDTIQTDSQNKKMKIEIWSDVSCPFCYIGKRKFEEALAQFENRDQIEFIWKSYQLDPTPQSELPVDLSMYQYLAQRKGISVKESENMHDNVTKMAKKVGLKYDFDKAKISNTFDAARLIHMADSIGQSNTAKEMLFAAHFTLGLDVANEDVLVQIGEKIGLNSKAIRQMLQSDALKAEVNQDIQEASTIGVTGVPFFVFDRKYAVSGAQDVSVFLQSIQQAYSEWAESSEK